MQSLWPGARCGKSVENSVPSVCSPAPPAVGQGYAQPLRDLVREVRPAAVEAVPVVADRPLLPLGQFRDTFIIAIDDDGIAIIDQLS